MPGARTYQAIGFATWHGGRVFGARYRAALRRDLETAAAVAGVVALVGLIAAVLAQALRRAGRAPTI